MSILDSKYRKLDRFQDIEAVIQEPKVATAIQLLSTHLHARVEDQIRGSILEAAQIAVGSVAFQVNNDAISITKLSEIGSDVFEASKIREPLNTKDQQKSFMNLNEVSQYKYLKHALLACRALDVAVTISTENVQNLTIENGERFSLFPGADIRYKDKKLIGVIKSPEIYTTFYAWTLLTLVRDGAAIGVAEVACPTKTPEGIVQSLNELFRKIISNPE